MLTLAEINHEMSRLDDWSLDGSSITKVFLFDNFKKSMEFVNKVAEISETANHHPEILTNYNQVKLVLTTHSEKGLTKKDFELAREIDKIN